MGIPKTSNPWCFQQNCSLTLHSSCAQRSIIDGIIPSCVVFVSLAFILVSIKNTCRKSYQKKPSYPRSATTKFDSITDAENNVIANKVYHAGLSWGGLSLLEDCRGLHSLPRSQVIKNAIISFCCAINVFLSALKANNTRRFGNNWLFIACATWVYSFFLSSLRIYPIRLLPFLPPIVIDKHIVPILLIFTCTLFVDLREVLIDQYSKTNGNQQQHILTVDILLFSLSLLSFLLEVFVPRPSPYCLENKKNASFSERTPLLGHPTMQPDKEQKIKYSPSFEIRTSLFSQFFYTFIDKFMISYWRIKPKPDDIPDLRPDDLTASILQRYRKSTENIRNRSLEVKLLWMFRFDLLKQLLWSMLEPIFAIIPSFLLNVILEAISARGSNDPNAPAFYVVIFAVVLMPLCQIIYSAITCQTIMISQRTFLRIKSILVAEMFAKVLRNSDQVPFASEESDSDLDLDNEDDDSFSERKKATPGKIQVMIANDIYSVSTVASSLNWLISTPLTMIFVITMLFKILGIAALAGLITALLFLLLSFFCGKRLLVHQERMRVATDERIKLATEAIQAIKTLKFFSWEKKFLEKMKTPRETELSELIKRTIWLICQILILTAGPNVIAAVSFGVHTMVLKRELTARTAFTSLSLFNVLRHPLDMLADMIAYLLESYVSLRRVDAYLNETETEKFDILKVKEGGNTSFLGFKDAGFIWKRQQTQDKDSQASDDFFLRVGTLQFPVGELSIITGPVGSGKTSLLLALLGEMPITEGEVFLPSPPMRPLGPPRILTDTVAYCAQTPWLLSATLRENILFGLDFDESRYNEVTRACALDLDIASLNLGDFTEVGERGTVLSGGQKARICLARALYSPARVILLDDVLSAVDTHTADHIHAACLQGPLLQGRSCILVTHAVSLCASSSSFIVCMQGGEVKSFGSPAKVGFLNPSFDSITAKKQNVLDSSSSNIKKDSSYYTEQKMKELKLIKEEEQNTGAVSFEVYKLYLRCFGGYSALLITLGINVLAQIVDILLQWWLRAWARSYRSEDGNISTFGRHLMTLTTSAWSNYTDSSSLEVEDADKTAYYLKIYSALTLLTLVMCSARMMQLMLCGIRASRIIYDDLIRKILGAKVRFFDTTPVGRILNKLSKDMEEIDGDIPTEGMFMLMNILWAIGIACAIALVIPSFIFVILFITGIYAAIAIIFIGSSREVIRLVSVTRSPMFGMFGEVINGVTTIRAFADGGRFLAQMCDYIDNTNRPLFLLWLSNCWLSLRVDITSALVTLAASLAVLFHNSHDAATAGFVLSFALLFQDKLLVVINNVTDFEISLNAVERIYHYLQLSQEEQGGMNPPAAWPTREGKVEVRNLCVRYDEKHSRVLHNISFEVEAREKVGIVGRTGSGKSTLALSFFRFVEAEEGNIIIDGLDIKDVKLSELRSRLVILPQEATLFQGTVRFNLDPFHQHDDVELWDALHKVGIGNRASYCSTRNDTSEFTDQENESTERHIISSLDVAVEDGGKNFSVGQRQLLALARGLLRLKQSSIVILDEASASLDSKTDYQVQRTIREEMGDATLLCIAHRLRTIIQFDKVLVLGEGRVLEYGNPAMLLKDPKSAFSMLCERSGEIEKLKTLASCG